MVVQLTDCPQINASLDTILFKATWHDYESVIDSAHKTRVKNNPLRHLSIIPATGQGYRGRHKTILLYIIMQSLNQIMHVASYGAFLMSLSYKSMLSF